MVRIGKTKTKTQLLGSTITVNKMKTIRRRRRSLKATTMGDKSEYKIH